MDYDVIIVGGGVTGTAVAFVLANYTDVHSIALVEKYRQVATVNSSPKNNSQTLHFGDTETNYDLEHALPVQDAAEVMMNYVVSRPDKSLFQRTNKMVLGVGEAEVAALWERFEQFSPHYPNLKVFDQVDLKTIEPQTMAGRNPGQPVLALVTGDGYAIDYQKLSESFLEDAVSSGKPVHRIFGSDVKHIYRSQAGFMVMTDSETLRAKAVVVAAGPFSLLFAQAMGYAKELAMLPVAGSFYFSPRVLRGKVYTVQTPELPFAAVHGDPDVTSPGTTRFGPTAKVIPLLERHRYRSMAPFLATPIMRIAGFLTMLRIMRNPVIARFILKNLFYDLPLVGKWLYLKQVRKIVPSMRRQDLRLGKGLGGLRPQIINTKTREMQMGESKIVEPGIIFNTTPSPGASVSLRNAEKDAQTIVAFLGEGCSFDQEKFNSDFRPAKVPAAK